jgi:hypothetical protein
MNETAKMSSKRVVVRLGQCPLPSARKGFPTNYSTSRHGVTPRRTALCVIMYISNVPSLRLLLSTRPGRETRRSADTDTQARVCVN